MKSRVITSMWVYDDYMYAHCSNCWHEMDNPEDTPDVCPCCGVKMQAQEDFFLEMIDAALKSEYIEGSKVKIYNQFLKQEAEKDNINFLKKVNGEGKHMISSFDVNNELSSGAEYDESLKIFISYDNKGVTLSHGKILFSSFKYDKTKDKVIFLSYKQIEKRIKMLIERTYNECDNKPEYFSFDEWSKITNTLLL